MGTHTNCILSLQHLTYTMVNDTHMIHEGQVKKYYELVETCAQKIAAEPQNYYVRRTCNMYLPQIEKKLAKNNIEKAGFVLDLLDQRLQFKTNQLSGHPFATGQSYHK